MNKYDNFIVHLKLNDMVKEFKEFFIEDLEETVKILNYENFMDFFKILVPIIDHKNYDKEILNLIFFKLEKFFTDVYLLESILCYLIDNRIFGYNKFVPIIVDKFLNEDTVGFFLYHKKNHMFPFVAKKKILYFYKQDVKKYLDDLDKLVIPEEEIFHFERENKKLRSVFVKYLTKKFSSEIIVEENLRWITDEDCYFEKIGRRRGLRYIRKQIKTFINKSENNILIIKLSLQNSCSESNYHNNCEEAHCHRNLLLFDKRSNILERFEPFGKYSSKKYNTGKMDFLLFEYFKKKDITYIGTRNCLYYGFQKIQSKCPIEKKFIKEGEPGRCIAWCLWYAETVLKNEIFDSDRYYFNRLLFCYFTENNVILTNYIRNYTTKILKLKY